MDALKLLGLCLIPLLLLITGDITLSFLFRKITHRLTRFSLQAIFGILFAYGIFIVAQGILSELKVPRILWGGFFDIAVGLGIGVFISCGAGVGFGYKHGYPFSWGRFKEGFHFRILASIFPALSEEIVFRGVIVQTVSHLV
ncbi:MAG: hypothetical protein HUU57_09175, partial [Bdellovibrio sp.]|nr:hypothetical protein [Bdellovibrio sp.]